MGEPKDKKDIKEIKEVIVVEGRDDTNAINRAVRAITIETHGFGISKETWEMLDRAYEDTGLIIFTDPDHAGKEIRKKLKDRYPDAKEAFLPRNKAARESNSRIIDIGIENAEPEHIIEALEKAQATYYDEDDFSPYTVSDLNRAGLTGEAASKERRDKLGDILGIGYHNSKSLIKVLNGRKIPRKDFENAINIIIDN